MIGGWRGEEHLGGGETAVSGVIHPSHLSPPSRGKMAGGSISTAAAVSLVPDVATFSHINSDTRRDAIVDEIAVAGQ